MQQYLAHHRDIPRVLAYTGASVALVLACGVALPNSAQALTAAEKQAEADAVYAQIDSLQTNLNKAMGEYERAQADYEKAIAKLDKAQKSIEKETKHIEELQDNLASSPRACTRKVERGRSST